MAEKPKKIHGKEALIIDIGSASVGGALMIEHHRGVPLLSHVKRIPVRSTADALPEEMKGSLATLLKEYAPRMKHGTVHVILAAPWHHAQIRTIQSSGDKPVAVSVRSVAQAVKKYKDEAPPGAGRTDLEVAALQVKVNGYATSLARPVMGTSLKINLYESEVDTAVRTSISEVVSREIPSAKMSLHSFPLVAASSLRVLSVENNFSFVTVGGAITDLAIMHADGIHFLASFPVGSETILHSLSGGDAAARLALYNRGELSAEESATLEATIASGVKTWIDACEAALKEGSEHAPIPRTLFCMCEGEILSTLIRRFASGGSMNLALTPITPEMLQRHIEIGEGGLYDTPLALMALFFHTGAEEIIGENTPSRMVQ